MTAGNINRLEELIEGCKKTLTLELIDHDLRGTVKHIIYTYCGADVREKTYYCDKCRKAIYKEFNKLYISDREIQDISDKGGKMIL